MFLSFELDVCLFLGLSSLSQTFQGTQHLIGKAETSRFQGVVFGDSLKVRIYRRYPLYPKDFGLVMRRETVVLNFIRFFFLFFTLYSHNPDRSMFH